MPERHGRRKPPPPACIVGCRRRRGRPPPRTHRGWRPPPSEPLLTSRAGEAAVGELMEEAAAAAHTSSSPRPRTCTTSTTATSACCSIWAAAPGHCSDEAAPEGGGINVLGGLLQQHAHHGMALPMTQGLAGSISSMGSATAAAISSPPSLQMQHFMAPDFGLLQVMMPSFLHGAGGNNNMQPSSPYGKLH